MESLGTGHRHLSPFSSRSLGANTCRYGDSSAGRCQVVAVTRGRVTRSPVPHARCRATCRGRLFCSASSTLDNAGGTFTVLLSIVEVRLLTDHDLDVESMRSCSNRSKEGVEWQNRRIARC